MSMVAFVVSDLGLLKKQETTGRVDVNTLEKRLGEFSYR